MQAVLYLQHNSNLLEKDTELNEQDLLAFSNIRVSIHHVITDRIDHLRPSQQLTLKVRPTCRMTDTLTRARAVERCLYIYYWQSPAPVHHCM